MSKEMTEKAGKTAAEAPETTRGERVYRPLTDIVETGEGVMLMLEMPGVASDEVDVMLERRILTIRGKVHPTAPEKLVLARAEYGEGDFERAFTLSEDFDPDTIEAALRNGVLTVTLARSEAAKPRRIAVQAA